jgi:hypothetical protein
MPPAKEQRSLKIMDMKLTAGVVPGCDVDRVKDFYEGRHRRPFDVASESRSRLREGISQLVARGDAELGEDAVQVRLNGAR